MCATVLLSIFIYLLLQLTHTQPHMYTRTNKQTNKWTYIQTHARIQKYMHTHIRIKAKCDGIKCVYKICTVYAVLLREHMLSTGSVNSAQSKETSLFENYAYDLHRWTTFILSTKHQNWLCPCKLKQWIWIFNIRNNSYFIIIIIFFSTKPWTINFEQTNQFSIFKLTKDTEEQFCNPICLLLFIIKSMKAVRDIEYFD